MTTPLADQAAGEQQLLSRVRHLAAGFAEEAAGYDERAEIPREALDALHAAGVTRALLSAYLGGTGLSYRAYGELVRVVARADPSVATILIMHAGAGVGLAELTHDRLGGFFAREFLAGKRFANALSEPAGGNRSLNPQQEALAAEGGWRLDGAKRFVSGSEIADYLLVNALVEGVPTFFGVVPDESVVIIPIWDTLGRLPWLATRRRGLSSARRCPTSSGCSTRPPTRRFGSPPRTRSTTRHCGRPTRGTRRTSAG